MYIPINKLHGQEVTNRRFSLCQKKNIGRSLNFLKEIEDTVYDRDKNK